MPVIVRCLGDAAGQPVPTNGHFLKSYDLEGNGGHGTFIFSPYRDRALRFADLAEFHATYKSSPKCHPIRLSDGKPNRPLTGFNWAIENVDE